MVRFKNRYIAVQVNHEKGSSKFNLSEALLKTTLFDALKVYHGDFGAAAVKMAFKAKYLNPITRVAILRAHHGPHALLASCIPLIKTMGSEKVNMRIFFVGATLKQCYKHILEFQKGRLTELIAAVEDPDEREELEEQVFSMKSFREFAKDVKALQK